MKKLKIYLDTSVINFLFADDAPEYKSVTEDFFHNFLHEYDVYISEIVHLEINKTDNPQNKYEDALHIAFCTYYEFDILLSWNFRHLANIRKQLAINSINRNNGYCKDLNLFNPMEVIYEK